MHGLISCTASRPTKYQHTVVLFTLLDNWPNLIDHYYLTKSNPHSIDHKIKLIQSRYTVYDKITGFFPGDRGQLL